MTSKPTTSSALSILNHEIIGCRMCPRLVAYREQIGVEKRRAYRDQEYWAKPVPGFGDELARVLLVGLAPGAHGSNRTGRMFTGDRSGDFMYPILHEVGFASQPNAVNREDGMRLQDCYISAAVRCSPPDNKALPEEIANCAPYLDREIAVLGRLQVVVGLGKIGFEAYLSHLRRAGYKFRNAEYPFGHAVEYKMPNGIKLLGSYHPSNQNTATGKLTAAMFRDVFLRARQILKS